MNELFKLTSRLSKIKNTPDEDKWLKNIFEKYSNDKKWQQQFYDYSLKWKLAPWMKIQLQRKNIEGLINPQILQSFNESHEKVKQENINRNKEATRFLRIFTDRGIDVALLKGNLFIHSVYHDEGYKKMNDFDMLIHPEDWMKVQKIYFDLGYIPLGFGWHGEKQKAAKFSHAGLSFISSNYHCITGTQWGLKSPTSKYTVDLDDLWENTEAFDFNDINVRQMSPEYNLLHLILHMGTYKCGIRDCMDVYNLFLTDKGIDIEKFVDICHKSNAKDKALFTLELANKCSGVIEKELLEKLKVSKNSFLISRLESRLKLFAKTGDFQHSYNDYFHDVEMTVFYFNLFHRLHQKAWFFVRLCRQMFWPKREIAWKLSDLVSKPNLFQKMKARIKSPFLVFKLIGEEIGLYIVFLLFFKLFVDTIFSVKNYFLKKETYFQYLRGRGISPDDIKKVVKGIQ